MNPLSMPLGSTTGGGRGIGVERRADRRYELALTVRWKLIHRRRVMDSGTGTTVDVSSGGLLLETDRQLSAGLNLEISIAWPALLHDVAPLQLVVTGRVVRAEGRRAAVRMTQHEFRTAGASNGRQFSLAVVPRDGTPPSSIS